MSEQNAKEALFREKFERYTKENNTLKNATYYALKEAILLQLFQDEITENQIASILGVSRTPIREAMLQLSRDGLLEITHGKKAKIVPLTTQDTGWRSSSVWSGPQRRICTRWKRRWP